MPIARRKLLQAVTLAGGFGTANAQEPEPGLDGLRDVSRIHGTNLSDVRLRVIRPALAKHLDELRILRGLDVDEAVGPTQGILSVSPYKDR